MNALGSTCETVPPAAPEQLGFETLSPGLTPWLVRDETQPIAMAAKPSVTFLIFPKPHLAALYLDTPLKKDPVSSNRSDLSMLIAHSTWQIHCFVS